MLIEVNDKKVREYFKNMYQDFKDSLVHTEETILLRDSLRKVVNNNKISLVGGGLIYDYISSQLENDCSYYIEKNLTLQQDIPVSENIQMVENIYEEWEYLNNWLKERFILKTSDFGLREIKVKERIS
ncbi:hypothetical protein N9A28_02595 [Sulfurimonas sp.]|nr:hypothetical protein [Sulfurimonas sp.]